MASDQITSAQLTERPSGILELIEAAAARAPEAAALVVTEHRTPIGYRALIGLVGDLADQLAQAGMAPGDRVGLRTRSSAEFVVGLLAGLRAGLVVVPLD